MDRIIIPLQNMGVPISSNTLGKNGCAPLVLKTADFPLKAIHATLDVASAQVKSCLLSAALAADGVSTIVEPGPSRDHTERMLRAMGVRVWQAPGYQVCLEPPAADLQPLDMRLPGDFSAAAFLLVAAAIVPGSDVWLRGVGLNPTRLGLVEALQAMGAEIDIYPAHDEGGEPAGDIHIRYRELQGGRVAGDLVVRMIDEFPAFAVAAAFAHGQTIVQEALELRHKESDRISALCAELQHLGVNIQETPAGFIVHGGQPVQGGTAHSHGDHRLAMSLALVGLVSQQPVTVLGAEIWRESYPEFPAALAVLGASVETSPA